MIFNINFVNENYKCYSIIMSFIKIPLSIVKRSMEKGDEKFNKNHRTFGNFNIKRDLNYIPDETRAHKLDIYTPVEKSNGITIFYVHGGAYVACYKELREVFASWFVNQGFTFVAINYRLGNKQGEIGIKDQVKDVVSALNFIEENKHYYKVPTDNLFLLGDSAGGHLCLMADIIFHNKEVQNYYGYKELPPIDIKGLAVNSTMYDFRLVVSDAKKKLTKKSCRWMLSNNYQNEEYIDKNNPRYYFKKGYKPSPLFANTSYNDYFNSQTFRLEKDCKELGIKIDYLFETSPRKEVGHVYNHFILDDGEGLKCNQMMVDFFIRNSHINK